MALSSILCIPGYMAVKFVTTKGTFQEVLFFCFIGGRHLSSILPFLQEFSDLPPCSALGSSSGSMADYVVGTVQ